MGKTIFVCGITGNQGGAIAKSLINTNWKVIGLTRNPNSTKAIEFKNLGAKVVKGDLNEPASYIEYLKDCYGVFSVQTFMEKGGTKQEVVQGKDLANFSLQEGVKHFVYSSVSGADEAKEVPHFHSKYQIEKHLQQLDLPLTIIRPGSFYENLLIPVVKKGILKGKLTWPLKKELNQEFIGARDIGQTGATVFANPKKYLNKTITLASDKMTNSELSDLLTDVLGHKVKYNKLPMFLTRIFMGKDLYKMFKYINKNKPEHIDSVSKLEEEFGPFQSFREWIKEHFIDQ